MAWTASLRSDIADTFGAMEGCGLPMQNSLETGERTAFGFGVWDPDAEAAHNREYMRGYQKRPAVVARRKLNRSKEYVAKNVAAKRNRLRNKIDTWKSSASMIMVGRDLPAEDWLEILRNPVSEGELKAFEDFCFFLKFKKCRIDHIASMLETNVSEVRSALASRGVT